MTNPNLNLKPEAGHAPNHPKENQPNTVATPEGDSEYAPDQPIQPAPDGLQKTPAIDTNKL